MGDCNKNVKVNLLLTYVAITILLVGFSMVVEVANDKSHRIVIVTEKLHLLKVGLGGLQSRPTVCLVCEE